jgi:hypothetical protein
MPSVSRPLRKWLLLGGKLLLAAALLTWVLGKVHWNDYVVDAETGEHLAVLSVVSAPDGPDLFRVREGTLWRARERLRPETDFQEVSGADGGRRVRPGFRSTLTGMQLGGPLAAVALFTAAQLLMAIRWRYLLKIVEIRLGLVEVVRLTFLGLFFNTVVPGTVGGDLVKAYYVVRHTSRKAVVLVSLFLDRVLGLSELAGMSAVMLSAVLLAGLAEFSQVRSGVYVVAVVLAGLIFAALVLGSRRMRGLLHLRGLYGRLKITRHLRAAGGALDRYRRHPGRMAVAMLQTVLAHVLFLFSIALMGSAVGVKAPLYAYFVYVPLIYIIGSVPLTPGGVGLVEGAFSTFFAPWGTPGEVLALALLARLLPLLMCLPGLYVVLTGPRLPGSEQIEAEFGEESLTVPPAEP